MYNTCYVYFGRGSWDTYMIMSHKKIFLSFINIFNLITVELHSHIYTL